MFGQRKALDGEAFSSSNTSSYVSTGELLLDPTSATGSAPFNCTLMTLVNMIYGSSGDMATQIASLTTSTVSTPLTAADLRANTYNKDADQSIVVRLGGLDWIVAYVSNDTDGNLVATLWLSNNHQEAWSGRDESLGGYYGFVSGGLYSDWSADWCNSTVGSYPSNMYGTSYIRVETLNNPNNRTYATSNSATISGTTQSTSHIFSLYTCSSKGLTQYLTTPNKMAWINNRQNPANRNDSSYWLANESLTSSNAYNYTASKGYYTHSTHGSMDYESKTGYTNWGTDYLWLPSMAETGYNDSYDGLWELSIAERSLNRGTANYLPANNGQLGSNNKSSGTTAYVETWSRSADFYSSERSSFLGQGGSDDGCNVLYDSRAVRPCLLLNLTEVVAVTATDYVSTGELLVNSTTAAEDAPFDAGALKTMVNMIYGASGDMATQISSLTTSTASTPLTAKTLRAKTYNKSADQSIIVRLGGLDWIVTYVSNDTDGNLVATMWLSNNHQEAWSGRDESLGGYYGFVSGGLYSDWSADWCNSTVGSYPSNMYGTSYIRVETLNNPNNRTYATSNSATISGTTQSTSHIFSLYTCSSKGLTQYLTTPNKMAWINNRQNPANRNDSSYWLANESLTSSNAYNYTASKGYYTHSTHGSMDYESKTGYANWGTDYLWLPSFAETGYDDSYDGLWELSIAERSTYDGSTTSLSVSNGLLGWNNRFYGMEVSVCTWSRSEGSGDACYSYYLYSSGSGSYYNTVYSSRAVRPCLLLNLTEIVGSLITFDQQGGAGGTVSSKVVCGDALSNITTPTHQQYIFCGYYTSPNGGGTKIYNSDGTPAVSTSPFSTDTTLYAYWLPYFDVTMSGASTQYTRVDRSVGNLAGGTLRITPAEGYIVAQISFDGSSWIDIEYTKSDLPNTVFAMNITYFANETSNVFVLKFEEFLHDFETSGSIPIYLKTVAGSYSGLKVGGGSVSGVAVQATFGGTATIVGADLESLGDDAEVIVAADIAQPGYAFCYWQDDSGNILSYDQSVKFKKSEIMDTSVTAVFAPMDSSNVSLDTDNS